MIHLLFVIIVILLNLISAVNRIILDLIMILESVWFYIIILALGFVWIYLTE